MRHDRATAGKAQAAAMRAIAGARPVPYWLDQPDAVIGALDEFFRGNWPRLTRR